MESAKPAAREALSSAAVIVACAAVGLVLLHTYAPLLWAVPLIGLRSGLTGAGRPEVAASGAIAAAYSVIVLAPLYFPLAAPSVLVAYAAVAAVFLLFLGLGRLLRIARAALGAGGHYNM